MDRLPEEILFHIFQYCCDAETLCAVNRVCRIWHRVSEDDLLWDILLKGICRKYDVFEHYQRGVLQVRTPSSQGSRSSPHLATRKQTVKGLLTGVSPFSKQQPLAQQQRSSSVLFWLLWQLLCLLGALLQGLKSLPWGILTLTSGPSGRFKVAVFGLDNSGKTTIIHRLCHNALLHAVPSYHPELEMLKVCGQNVSLLCPAGFASARRIWVDYAAGVDGVLFVVDAADAERLSEAADALEFVLKTVPESTPVLVLGNKRDVPTALRRVKLLFKLNLLSAILNDRPVRLVMGSSVRYDDSLMKGIEWLVNYDYTS